MKDEFPGRRSFPLTGRLGAVVIGVGLAIDTAMHTLVDHDHESVIAGFPVSEHLAHLVVFLGMALVLAVVVADGVRTAGRRQQALERSSSHAVR